MIILYDNYIDNAILTSDTMSTSKPLENIKSPNLSKYFQFADNKGIISIDLKSPTLISDIMLCGTNITSGYTKLILRGNNVNDFSTPSYESNMDRYTNNNVGLKVNEMYRYWQIEVKDVSLVKLFIGYLYIGDRLQLPGIDPSVELSYNNTTERSFSKGRQVYTDTGVDYFSSSFTFPIISDNIITIDGIEVATREDILEMWYYNKGATPLIMIIFDNDRQRIPPMVGVLDQNTISMAFDRTQGYYSTNINFMETK